MAKRSSSLADLDIEQEGMAQQDGLAARLARQRGQQVEQVQPPTVRETPAPPVAAPGRARSADPNSWRKGKALLQVALPEDIHVELSIIAKRRRVTLSQITKDALNAWLVDHNYHFKIPE
jgi:hypothetical protein